MGTRLQDLTETAQKTLEKAQIQKIFGMKNILSAGVILFCRLSDADQILLVQQANYDVTDPDESIRFVDDLTKKKVASQDKPDHGRAKSSG